MVSSKLLMIRTDAAPGQSRSDDQSTATMGTPHSCSGSAADAGGKATAAARDSTRAATKLRLNMTDLLKSKHCVRTEGRCYAASQHNGLRQAQRQRARKA